jgi:predicted AAA+ superfamily ATPase
MEQLIQISRDLVARTAVSPRRFLHEKIDWTWRLIGIRGARGTGKTTLLLQHLQGVEKGIYLSLDDLYFSRHSLRETIEALKMRGYLRFFLDEVHKYPDWSREVKNLYDYYPELMLVFTGSSIIELSKLDVDLSRRAVLYELPGLSFREYLSLTGIHHAPAYSLEDILTQHENISRELCRVFHPLAHFSTYLREGYYPYFLENRQNYHLRVRQVVRLVLETDLAQAEGAKIQQVQKLARLLQFLAASTPFKPNILNLSRHIELDRGTVLRYLQHLQNARLIGMLHVPGGGLSELQKPEKVFLENPNLAYALLETEPEVGNLRETFFFNQVSFIAETSAPDTADFKVADRYLFEVGGKGKKRRQLQGIPNSFLALDDLETGIDDQIPLWLFGFLY